MKEITDFPENREVEEIFGVKLEGLTLVYGESGSGKTAFALKVAEHFLQKNKKVLFLTTEEKYEDRERFSKLVNKYNKENIKFILVESVGDILSLIQKENFPYDVMIIDYIYLPIEAESKQENPKRIKLLKEILLELKKFSAQKKVPILITNQVYEKYKFDGTHSYAPLGGLTIYYLSNNRILLRKTKKFNLRILSTSRFEKPIFINSEGFIETEEERGEKKWTKI